ncbi:MAG: hypothetical protein GY788_21715 [bacterium]|nr:hypothetical protein [bacterium]
MTSVLADEESSWPRPLRRHLYWFPVRWLLFGAWILLYIVSFVTTGGDRLRRVRDSQGKQVVVGSWLLPASVSGSLTRLAPSRSPWFRLTRPWARFYGRLDLSPLGVRWVPRGDTGSDWIREGLVPYPDVVSLRTGRYSLRRSWLRIETKDGEVLLLIPAGEASRVLDALTQLIADDVAESH